MTCTLHAIMCLLIAIKAIDIVMQLCESLAALVVKSMHMQLFSSH